MRNGKRLEMKLPSIADVEVRTRVTEPRTGEREKSGRATLSTWLHSSRERRRRM